MLLDFQWDSVALEPLLYQNLSHDNCVLTACGNGLRKRKEDVRKDENVVSSITGGFQLCEVNGQDLKRASSKKMAGGGVDHSRMAHGASLTVADVVLDLPVQIRPIHTRSQQLHGPFVALMTHLATKSCYDVRP